MNRINKYFNKKRNEYFSFIDESGNTGLNLLDKNQPFFVLGNVFSQKNIDIEGMSHFQEIHKKIGKNELHANHEGNKGLTSITTDLLSLIKELNLSFHFSVIEKKHYLKIILFHHFYDNGLNPGVNTFAQGVRSLRLLLSLNFSQIVDDNHLEKYLHSLRDKNYVLYSEIHADLASKVKEAPFDYRTKELLIDALTYTAMNPIEIFNSMSLDTITSPNNSAFVLMINDMNGGFPKNSFFKKIIHDEQEEFGKSLKDSFDIFSLRHIPNHSTTFMTDFNDVELLKGTEFELKDSHSSLGLQTVDPAIWLFKRNILNSKEDSLQLWEEILSRTSFSGIGLGLHIQEVNQNHQEIMSKHISDEQFEKGFELLRKIETKRWKATK